jgi:hypothetical protein
MKTTKGLLFHLGLFGVASAVALLSATASKESSDGRRVEAELWPGPSDAITRISYEGEGQSVTLTPAKDAAGVYAVVEVVKAPKPDLGIAGAAQTVSTTPGVQETKRFIAVDEAEKLIAAMAPAKSYRSLGKLDASRLIDYGLDKPEAKITVTVGGKTYQVEVGALTPGSGDHYVRDPITGLVHTYAAEQVGKLKFAESRLFEHDLHGFNVDDVKSIQVMAGGKSRKVVRVEGKPNAWADTATPTTVDETVGNWLLKVQRLRPQHYVEKPDGVSTDPIVRIEYQEQKGTSGFLELFRVMAAEKKYLARSERSRWLVEIPASAAEPIDQDVTTIVK